MKTLKLAKDLSLPVDAITQTFLVVGKRGSGKSNTAARLVEQFHHANLPFVVLDPVDTWWGLKASRDGSGPGLDVYVFGGRKADLPLEPGAGALIAEVLCEHRISMVLSVKHLSGRERSAFMVAFAMTLFQKWQGGPLHVVLEEAHELAPQMAGGRGGNQDNEAAMLGAFKRLWKLGRASGIGGTAVTQRPASLSKDITTQSEILIAHRTIGPQDVKAIGEWVKYHGQHEAILGELPTLPTGEAFVWAPEFPADKPIGLAHKAILLRDTYDSASTPKVGEHRVEPKQLADVDIERLRAKMAKTIETAKANDPGELKKAIIAKDKRIKELEESTHKSGIIRTENAKPVAALTDADRALLEKMTDRFDKARLFAIATVADADVRLKNVLDKSASEHLNIARNAGGGLATMIKDQLERSSVKKLLEKLNGLAVAPAPAFHPSRPSTSGVLISHKTPVTSATARAPLTSSSGDLPPGELATLTAALTYPDGLDRKRLGVLTGYKRSTRDAYIARLQTKGLLDVRGQLLYATDEGRAALPAFEPLPTCDALIEYWRQRLPEGERKTLDVLLDTGKDTAREAIDDTTGYKRSSRDAYLTRLKARGLVDFVARGMVRASAELLEA